MLLGSWVVIAALTAWRYRAPEPRGADTPESEFSAVRAREVLDALLQDVGPHPRGSDANRTVQTRLRAALEERGWTTDVQRAGGCENVIATRPGGGAGDLVLLSAHYDSVPAGPGASDDGVGVAALVETARALAQHETPTEIALLITDGEEEGLLGARAFVASHPLARRVRGVVNLDARGNRGPSILFRASRGGFPAVTRFGWLAPRPVTNSVGDTVFRLLPNDTDLSVFLDAGWAGLDFAFIGGVERYHTAQDDLAHVSDATLQHHGDNALAAVRALAASDLEPGSDEVWTDVLAFFVVGAPAWLMPPLALLALVLAGLGWQRHALALRPTLAGAGLTLGPPVIAFGVLLAFVLARGVRFGWAEEPALPIAGACACGALVCAGAFALAARLPREAVAVGGAVGLGAGGLVLSVIAPGASYVLVLPALALGVAARAPNAALVAPISSALLTFVFPPLLYDALGDPGLPAVGACFALSLAPAAALFSRSPVASRSA